MTDLDPFGRSKEEDPLAEMGWSTSAVLKPGSGPADVAAPEPPDRAAHRQLQRHAEHPGGAGRAAEKATGRPNRRAGVRAIVIWLVALFMIGSISSVVIPAVLEVSETVERAREQPPGADRDDGPGPRDDERGEGRAPRGLERRSLLRRGNLAPALRRLRRVTQASRVTLLRIDPDAIVINVATRDGRTKLARASWTGEAEVLSSSAGNPGSTFSWASIDPSAPSRIVRTASRGKDPRVDYVSTIDPGIGWYVAFSDGRQFTADRDGSNVRKTG